MGNNQAEARQPSSSAMQALRLEVCVQQARLDCWQYTWDRDRGQLRLSGRPPGQADLPADLAILRLEHQAEVPVYVLAAQSLMPGVLVPVRVLGGFSFQAPEPHALPCAGWVLLATPDVPDLPPPYERLEQVSRSLLTALSAHAGAHLLCAPAGPDEPQLRPPEEVARVLREARLWLKRTRRQSVPGQPQRRRDEEPTVAWRAVEEVSDEQREQIAHARRLSDLTHLLQAEQLIRFVPARFQQTLQQVLLDDEHVLAFVERPVLRHRTGWLGLRKYRANAGLFLLTDRQALWVRDFFSPGASAFPEGYIAHSLPLERLTVVSVLPAGASGSVEGEALPRQASPYLHLRLCLEGSGGQQALDIAFSDDESNIQALARITGLLQDFLPRVPADDPGRQDDRRVRRLPVVDAWMPQGAEARRLRNLGGVVPQETTQALEQRLANLLAGGEELLVSVLVPALEQYRSPARLVALTRAAILILDGVPERARGRTARAREGALQAQRYPLAQLSSVQLSYSLLGSELRLFVPRLDREAQQIILPFQSPAIAWFLPLFTRLRLALSVPVPQARPPLVQKGSFHNVSEYPV